jgi:hypothetical protein
MKKKIILDPWGKSKGTTYIVLFSHSQKLMHSRDDIVFYWWNYFAGRRKQDCR